MAALVVSIERNRYLQQHRAQTHAEVVLPTSAPVPGRLRYLLKEFVIHDEDGRDAGRRRERASVVTTIRVDDPLVILEMGLEVARGCGSRTLEGFQEAWLERHPRSPLGTAVWFALGDWRDQDMFMNRAGTAGGDYTRNARRALDPDAPVLTREQIDALSSVNHQKDDARRAALSKALADENPSQRMDRIDRFIERLRAEAGEGAARQAEEAIRPHRRVWEQRIARAEHRKDD